MDNEIPLESEFSILIDASTGHIIHEVNMHERAYPASITKVMTALLLLESGHGMQTPVVHSFEAISTVMPWHSGLADVGEFLTVEESLYAILLASANDTSNAIAEFLGGNMENFAQIMTSRAHELGAFNTNFTNAHGLWEEDHATTAYDISIIMREALTHDLFREIIATQRFTIPPSATQEEYRIIYNTNNMIFPTSMHFSPDIIGGKTGFTNNSRHTLVSYAQRGDLELISVVLYADQRPMIFSDTRMLMEHGFEGFLRYQAFLANDFEYTIDLVQRSGDGVLVIGDVGIVAEGDMILSLPAGFNTDGIEMSVHLPNRIVAPVTEGFLVGRILIEHDGTILAEVPLRTAHAGLQLSEQDLAAILPGGGAVVSYATYGADEENVQNTWSVFNIALAIVASIVVGFLLLRFLQFSHRPRRRRKSLGKYRGNRGYSRTHRAYARDYKFKYRYK